MTTGTRLLDLTSEVAAAYLSNHVVPPHELAAVFQAISSALSAVGVEAEPAQATEAGPSRVTPAQIRKSIRPDVLVSFEDGKPYRTLKRHLTRFGLTPDSYRAKWGLPTDYPMTAPSYSETRRALAVERGLGRKPAEAAAAE